MLALFADARTLNNDAARSFEFGDYVRAERLYLDAITRAEADSVTAGIIHCNLAVLYRLTGRYEDAVRSAYEGSGVLGGASPESPHLITCLNTAAEAARNLGRFEDAEEAARRSLQMAERFAGKDSVQAGHAAHTLANVLQMAGVREEAAPLYERALALRRAHLGLTHPMVGTTLAGYASVLAGLGRARDGEAAAREAVELLSGGSAGNDVHLIAAYNNLGQTLQMQQRFEEAEPMFRRGMELSGSRLGLAHPDTARLKLNLAAYYYEAGRLRAAAALYDEAATALSRKLGSDHAEVRRAWNSLAVVYRALGRKTEAAAVERRAAMGFRAGR